jgi:hypothetical protein
MRCRQQAGAWSRFVRDLLLGCQCAAGRGRVIGVHRTAGPGFPAVAMNICPHEAHFDAPVTPARSRGVSK